MTNNDERATITAIMGISSDVGTAVVSADDSFDFPFVVMDGLAVALEFVMFAVTSCNGLFVTSVVAIVEFSLVASDVLNICESSPVIDADPGLGAVEFSTCKVEFIKLEVVMVVAEGETVALCA